MDRRNHAMAVSRSMPIISVCSHPASKLLTKAASGVLTSLRGSTYGPEYDSPLRSLRPYRTAFLNSLRGISIRSVTGRVGLFGERRRVC
jgi:hypothetical protein